jgi:hypothetical protein
MTSTGLSVASHSFDKRIEELGSPSTGEEIVNSPFTSPPIIGSPMEFPGLGDYGGFHDLSSPMPTPSMSNPNMSNPQLGNYGEGVGGGGQQNQITFKQEFNPPNGLLGSNSRQPNPMEGVRRPPLRQRQLE